MWRSGHSQQSPEKSIILRSNHAVRGAFPDDRSGFVNFLSRNGDYVSLKIAMLKNSKG
jgi:hypothetical protein